MTSNTTRHNHLLYGDTQSLVQQLRRQLEHMILTSMEPGEKIPSEAELGEKYNVSRGTVREALKLIEQRGLLRSHHGIGRFVSPTVGLKVESPVTKFESLTEMLERRGFDTTVQVLSNESRLSSVEESNELVLPQGRKVVQLKRIRLHKNTALIASINIFDADLLQGKDPDDFNFSGSLVDWLKNQGHYIVSSSAKIYAVNIPNEFAMLSEIDSTQPWLLISELCVDQNGSPVLMSRDYHRGDTFTFNFLRQRED